MKKKKENTTLKKSVWGKISCIPQKDKYKCMVWHNNTSDGFGNCSIHLKKKNLFFKNRIIKKNLSQ